MDKFLHALFALIALLLPAPAGAGTAGIFAYRGFIVDVSAEKDSSDLANMEASLAHQIDIVADCGANVQTLAFFRAQQIAVEPGMGDIGGEFGRDRRVVIDAAPAPPRQPILLHELLHAYHARALPGGFNNGDVMTYYSHAKEAGLYPPQSYLLTDRAEFFAVTASLYLSGHVDREPFTREELRERQPYYYAWLGQLFGVRK